MYPDSLLIVLLPFSLYAGLAFAPKTWGPKAAGIASGAAALFLLASAAIFGEPGPSFDAAFDAIFGVAFASALLGAALGGLAYHRIVRERARLWPWRGAGLAIAVVAGAAVFIAMAAALDM